MQMELLNKFMTDLTKNHERLLRKKLDDHANKFQRAEYVLFRRLIQKLGTSYIIAPDGYLDIEPFDGFPQGISVYHYDWIETMRNVKNAIADPHKYNYGALGN